MFNVGEQALGEVIRFGRALTVNEAQIRGPLQIKWVADIIDGTILCSMTFIVLIAKFVRTWLPELFASTVFTKWAECWFQPLG